MNGSDNLDDFGQYLVAIETYLTGQGKAEEG